MATVYMKTPSGKSAGVNPKYVDEYIAKGYTVDTSRTSSGSSGSSSTTSKSTTPTKTIEDYSKDYYAAKEAGNAAGMQAANEAANALRIALGQTPQYANVDIGNIAKQSGGSSGSSSGGTTIAPTKTPVQYMDGFEVGLSNGTITDTGKYYRIQRKDGSFINVPITSIEKNGWERYIGEDGYALSGGTPQIEDNISGMYDEQKNLLIAQLKQAIAQAKGQYQGIIDKAPQQYQQAKDTAEINKMQGLDRLREVIANRGDSGGIGRQQMLEADTAGQKLLSSIEMQQQNLIDEANLAISQLESQGNFQEAQITAETAMEKLRALIEEQRRFEDNQYRDSQAALQKSLAEAQLTGTYGGQRTLQGQQFDWSTDPNNPSNIGLRLENQFKELQLGALPQQIKDNAALLQQQLKLGQISVEDAQYKLNELQNPESRTNKLFDMEYKIKELELRNMPERMKLELDMLKKQIANIGKVAPRTEADMRMDEINLKIAQAKLDAMEQGESITDAQARQMAAQLATTSGFFDQNSYDEIYKNLMGLSNNPIYGSSGGLDEFFK